MNSNKKINKYSYRISFKLLILIFILVLALLIPNNLYKLYAEEDENSEANNWLQYRPSISSLLVPGTGQLQNKQYIKGYILLGIHLSSVFFAILLDYNYKKNMKEYEDLNYWYDQSVFDEKYNRANKYYKARNYVSYLLLTSWLYSVVDAEIYYRIRKSKKKEEQINVSMNIFQDQYSFNLNKRF